MKKNLIILFALIFSFTLSTTNAQNRDKALLLIIGNDSIMKNEFLNTYQKNNQLSETSEQELRDYLDLFINFKLKVMEGKALKIDTAKSFIRELASYQNQSAQQYLTDTEVTEQIMEEAFERSKYHIRAAHILIKCKALQSPKDTLAAYQKIMQIRNEIVSGKISFNDAAVKYSEDESARDFLNPNTQKMMMGNKGELGYFTVLDLIYLFENGAYNTKVNEISMPVRTSIGYHLIWVEDKIPAINKIYASQIFIADTLSRTNQMSDKTKSIIEEINNKMKANVSFENLVATYSDDVSSREKSGRIEPFAPNRRAGNFVQAVLKNDLKPVATSLGWHIIRLDSISYFKPNDETKYNLKSRLQRDTRSQSGKESLIEKLKVEYNFNEKGKDKVMKFLINNIPENYFQSTKISLDTLPGIDKLPPLFTFADQIGNVKDYLVYISRFQGINLTEGFEDFLEARYKSFVQDKIIAYESASLINKYPEYKELINEFYEGMILYEVNTQKVWTEAIRDSIGLQNYYEKIKINYPIDPKANPVEYKSMKDIRAIVITEYQNYLDEKWLQELKKKYPVIIKEDVFSSILK